MHTIYIIREHNAYVMCIYMCVCVCVCMYVYVYVVVSCKLYALPIMGALIESIYIYI